VVITLNINPEADSLAFKISGAAGDVYSGGTLILGGAEP
jgi:hypothetical protein